MTQLAYSFVENLRQEVMMPQRLLTSTAWGVLGTIAIDAVGFDGLIGTIASSINLSPQRTNQVAAGLTFATLSALERATMKSLV